MNWKNTAENLALVLISILVGVGIGYYVSIQVAETMLNNQKDIIVEAIRKETTAINNTVKTEINKVKNRKGEPINIVVEPYSNNELDIKKNIQDSTPAPEPKRGFFRRIFGGKPK
ncbi:hypothetical protein [Pseudotamlana carrageenivorans]|uniref:Uncharacterized protein n=1 Tax=Pseudotamlana carrageenivorans TaxID=2069432 RepID=A0A2I7SF54_9FLAO|nr:hypothetical protein [Tamlana carrageenivorans]AUS04490.1 hypothetical protein C1A40_02935 [Tamlana carrageenivorans]